MKKEHGVRSFRLLLSFALLSAFAVSEPPDTAGAQDASAQEEFDEVLAEERELQAELDELESTSEELNTRIDVLEADLAEAQNTRRDAEADEESKRREARYQRELEQEAADEVVRTRELLGEQAVAAYVSGGGETVAGALLRARSGEDAETALVYSEVVLDDTDALIRRLERAEEDQRAAAAAARTAREAASEHRQEAAEAEADLSEAHELHDLLRDELESNTEAQSSKLDEVRSRKTVLQTTVTAQRHASDGVQQMLAAVQAGQPSWRADAVTMANPLPGHTIGSPFGVRHHPILGIDRLHAGSDMGAASGTPIRASGDGVVVFAGDRGGFGNVVIIDHGHQLGTVYAHQSSVAVSQGKQVERGEVIGHVGTTGLSTGPHLHFETRILGVPVDPPTIVDFGT